MYKSCPKCNIEHNKSGMFCSRSCANSRGPRNEDFKRKVSEKLTGSKLTFEQREKCRDNRWGKNYQKKSVKKLCINCDKEFETYNVTDCCSEKCRKEFVEQSKTAYQNYYNKCQFSFNVYNYPEWFNINLVEEHGWYKAKNRGDNLNGVSRDHRISVKEGFVNNIDPSIISHPANCELKLHKDNQKKRTKSSVTIDNLIKDIAVFNSKYNYDPMAE